MIVRLIPYIAALAVVVAVLFSAYRQGESVAEASFRAEMAVQDAAREEHRAQDEREERAKEQRHQAAIEEVRKNARIQIERLEADVAAADAAASRLRDQARRLASRARQASGNSGAACGSAPASDAGMVLADMLSRVDERAGELAREADRARAAGTACERAYESVKAEE